MDHLHFEVRKIKMTKPSFDPLSQIAELGHDVNTKPDENIQIVKAIQSTLVFTRISETRNNFKIDGKLFESEYDIDGKLIRFQLTSGKGEGFSYKIYSEGKKIGTTQKDSWTQEPFYYKNENIGVLFIANGDEGGIWGYTVFIKLRINLLILDLLNSHL